MATGFPGSRTIVTILSTRTTKATGETTTETRHYLSSQGPEERTAKGWITLVRNHWAIENKNHNPRDTTLREDLTRKLRRNPQALANMALLRNIALRLLASSPNPDLPGGFLPEKVEWVNANPHALWQLLQHVP